ncbi:MULTISPECIES: DUF1427 family protein [Sphingomonadaceae]|jgi:XapX domain-containing protein|uniref:DUF1427 family protein n=1 Tax=Sphingomonadales TaxID=204457 RepID=UPI00082BA876|nr:MULTISPECIES: DUF1427 family protein [Sphingomonadaceae]MBA4780324.1 DUF1427 family protein [Blastomonas sp.]MBX9663378.1 XapX domain-containing protein [Novosphingobium sp.]MBY0619544.1 XapX domain-containing protein [Sphingomonas ursincola]OHD02654.1 MAG: XapX domain-containing protein [Sphingopyxis sp. RIFCSPHIGHO2_01_FULL_65_24]
MKIYLFSLGAGLLVGIIYSLLGVRSPAPPVVALLGLLGMLVGEQILPFAMRVYRGNPDVMAETRADCSEHILGALPARPGLRRRDSDA